MRNIESRIAIALATFCWIIVFHSALINIPVATNNVDLMLSFESDEGREVGHLKEMVDSKTMATKNFQYGAAYPQTAYVLILGLKSLGYHEKNVVPLIGQTMRLLSLLCAMGTMGFAYLLFRSTGINQPVSIVGLLILGSMGSMFHWAQQVHPDTMQLMFMFAAAYFSYKSVSFKSLLLGSFFIGLAFGTKHFGILLAPFLAIPYLFRFRQDRLIFHTIRTGAACIAAAFVGWLIFNWRYLFNFVKWARAVGGLSRSLARGFGRSPEVVAAKHEWFGVIVEELSLPNLLLATVGLAALVYFAVRRRKNRAALSYLTRQRCVVHVAMLAYVLFGLVYLFLRINYREHRFLLPILPFALPPILFGIQSITQRLSPQLRLGALLLLLAAPIYATGILVKQKAPLSNKMASERLELSAFLEKTYEKDAVIVQDMYAYVSPHFTRKAVVWGITHKSIKKADVVILTKGMTGRWVWKKPGTRFAQQEFISGYMGDQDLVTSKKRFLTFLSSPSSGFRVAHETDNEIVLERLGVSQ